MPKENKPSCGWCGIKNDELKEGTILVIGGAKIGQRYPYICTECVDMIHDAHVNGNKVVRKQVDGFELIITKGLI